jgi:threonine dehydratase
MNTFQPIPLAEIQAARARLAGTVLHTPLVRFNAPDMPAETYLKLENLQQVGSFKIRAAGNAMLSADPARLADGVWTASAGNMAQAVAWYARRLGLVCTAVVPEDAPPAKLSALRRLNAKIIAVPFADYQSIQRTHVFAGMSGLLIHPFADPAVMAGDGTLGMEILEDLPDVDVILVPYGGGGLSCGIASAVHAANPKVKIIAVEVASAAPLTASLAAGQPVEVPYAASFVSGIGAPFIFPEMWPLASRMLDGAFAVELTQVAEALRLQIEWNHVVAEGAGAVALALALSGKAGGGKIVCLVSGGNIDMEKLVAILGGRVP